MWRSKQIFDVRSATKKAKTMAFGIHKKVDSKESQAVVLTLLDLSKAYNRGSIKLVLIDLFNMHISPFLIAIISLYLKNRTMTLVFNGMISEIMSMPGGFSQGCYLSVVLFIIKFNGALLRPPVPRCICSLSQMSCNEERMKFRAQLRNKKLNPGNDLTCKFVDDCCAAATYKLKEAIEKVAQPYVKPVTFNQRTGHCIKEGENKAQTIIDDFCDFTSNNKFVINQQ